MAKGSEQGMNPSVNWFFNDWSGGTSILSRHLKGCYMDLLHAQFNNGHISLAEIKTVLGSDFGSAWPALQKKFATDEKGLFYNKRLEVEILKKKNYSESRKRNGSSGGESSPHMGYGNGIGNDIEQEKGNDTITKPKTRKGMLIPSLQEVQEYFISNGYPKELAARFFNGYNEANWVDSQGQAIKNWKQKAQHVWFKEENKKPQHLQAATNTTALPLYWNYVPDSWDAMFNKRIENENDAVRKIQAYEKKLKANGYHKTADGWIK